MEFLEKEYKTPSCPKDVFKVTQAVLTPQASIVALNLNVDLKDFGAMEQSRDEMAAGTPRHQV